MKIPKFLHKLSSKSKKTADVDARRAASRRVRRCAHRCLTIRTVPHNRQALQRAVNHYHADLYRKCSDRLTPVAGIPMTAPEEAIEEPEFYVKTMG